MSPNSENFGWAILAATFLGPIAAVLVTRYVDRLRERNARRLSIFRTLMATRRSFLSPEHISALNQIELDFQSERGVMNTYHSYMKHRTKLLSEMAKTLHIRVEQLDIFEGGYVPQRHVDIETEQATIRRLLTEIANGKRSLPIEIRSGRLPK